MPNDLAKLQGAWTLTALEIDGGAMPAAGSIVIEGETFKAVGMGADYGGTVEIDDQAKPKHLDLVFTSGPEAGNRNKGIYELRGDRLKLCLNMTGKSRPRAFATKPGSGNALEVFTRGAAAEEEPAPAATTAGGAHELAGEWQMVAAYQGGYPLDHSMVSTGRRITSDTETTTVFGKQVFMRATYTTDAAARPKTIDLLHTAGRNKGKTQLGIYEIEGDTMKICFTNPGLPRPVDFESKAGDGRTSAVWKKLPS